jgi:hypothetical protein
MKSKRTGLSTLLIAALSLLGHVLWAEEAPIKLTMQESVEVALRNNRALAAAQQENVKARGRIVEARSEALPELSFDIAATHTGAKPEATFGGESFSLGRQDNYTMSANLSQALYKGGRIRAGLRAAGSFAVHRFLCGGRARRGAWNHRHGQEDVPGCASSGGAYVGSGTDAGAGIKEFR